MLSSAEQLLLEYINRARLDPLAEAERYGIDLNKDLAPGTLTGEAREALAPNAILAQVARDYSEELIDEGRFSHTGSDGRRPWDRMEDAGYDYNRSGENLAVRYTSGWSQIDGDAAIPVHHAGLFDSSGHRKNMLSHNFREVGVGQAVGDWNYQGGDYHASIVTEKFGRAGTDRYITGVAYDDLDGDGFYSIGEGVGGVRFDVEQTGVGVTYAAGGYTVAVPQNSGLFIVYISGNGANATVGVDTEGQNAKLDLIGSDTVQSSADLSLFEGISRGVLLGVEDLNLTGGAAREKLEGNRGANEISGGDGHDTIDGGEGADTLNGGSGGDQIRGENGNDEISGEDGNDRLWGGRNDDLLNGGAGNDRMWGQNGADTLLGGEGSDSLYGGRHGDRLEGGDRGDLLRGDDGRDWMHGQRGNDTLDGGSGHDRMFGGDGMDALSGGAGNDVLNGHRGDDTLTGDSGNDRFVFAGAIGKDLITDFTHGEDVIVMGGGNREATSFAEFMGATTQVGADAVYDLGADGWHVITLAGIDRDALTDADFDFG